MRRAFGTPIAIDLATAIAHSEIERTPSEITVAAKVTRLKSVDPPPYVGGYGQDLRGRHVIFQECLFDHRPK